MGDMRTRYLTIAAENVKTLKTLYPLSIFHLRCVLESGEKKNVTITITSSCGEGYTQCRDGTCIRSTDLCDGRAQCRDRSDEDEIFCKGKGIK